MASTPLSLTADTIVDSHNIVRLSGVEASILL
jgi:hypothetical protein